MSAFTDRVYRDWIRSAESDRRAVPDASLARHYRSRSDELREQWIADARAAAQRLRQGGGPGRHAPSARLVTRNVPCAEAPTGPSAPNLATGNAGGVGRGLN